MSESKEIRKIKYEAAKLALEHAVNFVHEYTPRICPAFERSIWEEALYEIREELKQLKPEDIEELEL